MHLSHHPRHVKSSAVNRRLTQILRGQVTSAGSICFKNELEAARITLWALGAHNPHRPRSHQTHILSTPIPWYIWEWVQRSGIFKKISNRIIIIDQTHFYTSFYWTLPRLLLLKCTIAVRISSQYLSVLLSLWLMFGWLFWRRGGWVQYKKSNVSILNSFGIGMDFFDMLTQVLIRCVNIVTQFAIKLSYFHSHSVCYLCWLRFALLVKTFSHVSHWNSPVGATLNRTTFVPQVFLCISSLSFLLQTNSHFSHWNCMSSCVCMCLLSPFFAKVLSQTPQHPLTKLFF